MKRLIALILSFSMLLTGCGKPSESKTETKVSSEVVNSQEEAVNSKGKNDSESDIFKANFSRDEIAEQAGKFRGIDDENLHRYIENYIYADITDNAENEDVYIEDVKVTYISKEYLDEIRYNSRSNIFFGYSLEELNDVFQGDKYIFTLNENGMTTAEKMDVITEETSDKIVKDVAIGTGIILVQTTVALATANPIIAGTAGKAVRIIFTISANGANAAKNAALVSAGISGAMRGVQAGIQTDDLSVAIEEGVKGAAEGFKVGAVYGSIEGMTQGIKVVKHADDIVKYFREKTEQAEKYSKGVKFTKGKDGEYYPRFEEWAIKTVKFDEPTIENLQKGKCLTSNYYKDSMMANHRVGLDHTPQGYVWHHVEDMQTLILVPQDVHSVAMGGMAHKGGASLIREVWKNLGVELV